MISWKLFVFYFLFYWFVIFSELLDNKIQKCVKISGTQHITLFGFEENHWKERRNENLNIFIVTIFFLFIYLIIHLNKLLSFLIISRGKSGSSAKNSVFAASTSSTFRSWKFHLNRIFPPRLHVNKLIVSTVNWESAFRICLGKKLSLMGCFVCMTVASKGRNWASMKSFFPLQVQGINLW